MHHGILVLPAPVIQHHVEDTVAQVLDLEEKGDEDLEAGAEEDEVEVVHAVAAEGVVLQFAAEPVHEHQPQTGRDVQFPEVQARRHHPPDLQILTGNRGREINKLNEMK
jgi:hypothetical protein